MPVDPPIEIEANGNNVYEFSLKKTIVSQIPLTRSPCSKNNYLTCQYIVLHRHLAEKQGCQAPILKSGLHLKRVVNVTQPICSSNELLSVSST